MKEKTKLKKSNVTSLGVCVLTANEQQKKELDRVHESIKTLARFQSTGLPEFCSSSIFDTGCSRKHRLSFWIQDLFLVEQEIKGHRGRSVFRLVDDSLGKIQHIALSYYNNNDYVTQKNYNKIYVNLLTQLIKIFDGCEEQGHSVRAINFIGNRQSNQSAFEHLIEKLNGSFGFEAGYKTFDRLLVKGGNLIFAGGRALIGYDAILETYRQEEPKFDELRKTVYGLIYKKYENSGLARKTLWRSIRNHLEEESGKSEEQFFADRQQVEKAIEGLKDQLRTLCTEWENRFKAEFAELTHVNPDHIFFIGSKEVLLEMIAMDIDLVNRPSNRERLSWINDGYSAQGIFHLDLFISAAGKDEIQKNNCLLVGEPIYEGNQQIPLFDFTKKVIDDIATKLVEEGFAVYRNPLPLTYIDRCKDESETRFERTWFFASYNNCLVQYTKNPQDRYVWMPVYGGDPSNGYPVGSEQENKPSHIVRYDDSLDLRDYDQLNEEVWQRLSFQVVKLANYLPFAELRGATRCLSKVLSRTAYE